MDDRAAVIDTVNLYATALDARDWTLLDEVFAPDVEADYGAGLLTGRETVRKMVRSMLGATGPSQHLLANHRVRIEGDSAHCTCQVRAFSAGTGRHAGQTFELFGEYRDRLARTAEGWRITRRQMIVNHEIGSRDIFVP